MTNPLTLSELVPAQTLAKALLEAEAGIREVDDNFRGGIQWACEAQERQTVIDRLVEVCERTISMRDKALAQIQRIKKGEMV